MDETEVPKTLQEALVTATEYELYTPIMEEHHEDMLRYLREIGLCGKKGHSWTTSGFFNRKETALTPPLEWQAGNSTLRVYVVLVTEVIDLTKDEPYKNLGWGEALTEGDELARILLRAFNLLRACDGPPKIEGHLGAFYPQYVETKDGTRSLRMYMKVNRRYIDPQKGENIKIASYIKFYKNGHPRPYGGTNEDVVPI